MSCKTVFHELLHLVRDHLPEEKKYDFYKDLIQVTQSHGIHLHILIGEDEDFDRAYEEVMKK